MSLRKPARRSPLTVLYGNWLSEPRQRTVGGKRKSRRKSNRRQQR